MDKELKDGEIGKEGKYSLEIENGDFVLEIAHDSKGISGSLRIRLDSDYFLDQLKDKIPGKLDDTVIDLIKEAIN